MSKHIEALVNIDGISGFETEVKNYLLNEFSDLPIKHDNIGGFAAVLDKGVGTNILVLAHMDEVGLMLKRINDNGICSVTNIGGFVPATLFNSRVVAHTNSGKTFEGVILGQSPHGNDGKVDVKIEDLAVDFGFASRDEAVEAGFELGIMVALKNDYAKLANNRIVSKALDNRLGCAAIVDLYEIFANSSFEGKIYFGASVQEEVGLRGAGPLMGAINDTIDYALIVDVSPVDDIKQVTNGGIGNGTLIRVQDPRTVLTVSEVRKLRELGDAHEIKHQDFFSKGGTDASAIQISGSGVKTCALCVPGRNLHTHNSVISLDDYQATVDLAAKYIESRLSNE